MEGRERESTSGTAAVVAMASGGDGLVAWVNSSNGPGWMQARA